MRRLKLLPTIFAALMVLIMLFGTTSAALPESRKVLPSVVSTPVLASEVTQSAIDGEIDAVLATGKAAFVFFYAEWCHYCQQEKPIVDALEPQYAEDISFIRIDGEANPEACAEFGVNGYPTMFLIADRNAVGQYVYQRLSGFAEEVVLQEAFDYLVANGELLESAVSSENMQTCWSCGSSDGLMDVAASSGDLAASSAETVVTTYREQGYLVAHSSTPIYCGVDMDDDGLNDPWENAAATEIRPYLVPDENEDLFANPDHEVVFLVKVEPIGYNDGRQFILFTYVIAWSKDYGRYCDDPAICYSHNGDSERVAMLFEVADSQTIYLVLVYTAAHEGEGSDHSGVWNPYAKSCNKMKVESWPDQWQCMDGIEFYNNVWVVYVSEDKHASYPTCEVCENAILGAGIIEEDCGNDSGIMWRPPVWNVGQHQGHHFIDVMDDHPVLSGIFPGEEVFWPITEGHPAFCGGLGGYTCGAVLYEKLYPPQDILDTMASWGLDTLWPAKHSCNVQNVRTEMYFQHLQDAIDDPTTLEGDQLKVDQGLYTSEGTVSVYKPLTITGFSSRTGVRNGVDLLVLANGVKIYTLSNSKVTLVDVTGCNVESCVDMRISLNGATGCSVRYCDQSVISLSASDGNTISNNVAKRIHLEQSDGNTVIYNTVYPTGDPLGEVYITLDSSNGNSVQYNQYRRTGAPLTGAVSGTFIRLYLCYDNLLFKNEIVRAEIGIHLVQSDHNSIGANRIRGCDQGIVLNGVDTSDEATSNAIYTNTIAQNGVGLTMLYATHNEVSNNFFDNTINALDEAGENVWNGPSYFYENIVGGPWMGGNFWSDYAGVDTDFDGLGDTNLPHNCGGEIVNGGDNGPLTIPTWTGPVQNLETGEFFDSIQQAIDDADTLDGHALAIRPGYYFWDTNVTKSVTIRSISGVPYDTVISSSGLVLGAPVFYVTASGVTIEGLAIADASGRLLLDAAGIELDAVTDCTIRNNALWRNDVGIWLSDAAYNTIEGNDIVDSNTGIYLGGFCEENYLRSNGIYNAYEGIWLEGGGSNGFYDNSIANDYIGIRVSDSDDNTIEDNSIWACYETGILLESSPHNYLRRNDVESNNWANISLEDSSDSNLLEANLLLGGEDGIRLDDSSYNEILGNTITARGCGIRAFYSNSNKIHDNWVVSNPIGIYLSSSVSSDIWNNYFDNTVNAYADNENDWTVLKHTEPGLTNIIGGLYFGGNYWSDYTGEDVYVDGLGDTLVPYNCNGGIAVEGDYSPLVPVFTATNVGVATSVQQVDAAVIGQFVPYGTDASGAVVIQADVQDSTPDDTTDDAYTDITINAGVLNAGTCGVYKTGTGYLTEVPDVTQLPTVKPPGEASFSRNVADNSVTVRLYVGDPLIALLPASAPFATFTDSPPSYEGSVVTFDASDSFDPDGTIVLFEWDFDNDGVYDYASALTDATYTWGDDYAGMVTLRVTDNAGQTDVYGQMVVVFNVAPSAAPISVDAGVDGLAECSLEAVLLSSAFTDPGWLDTHTIHWDFGDGVTADGSLSVSHLYTTCGTYTVTLTVTDDDGGIGVATTTATVVDSTSPSMAMVSPPSGYALQDGVTFVASANDNGGTGVNSVTFSIREDNGGDGIDIGYEDIPMTLDSATGKWSLWFDTLQVPDGWYVVVVKATDNAGNVGSITVPYSIRNWAVLELLPETPKNKAGRTMPVKFSLRVSAAVDPAQPFVYNEELTIKICATSNPGVILQTSVFGTGSTNYRIDTSGEKYITNFKTSKVPMQYTVEIWRTGKNFLVGSFTFKTVK